MARHPEVYRFQSLQEEKGIERRQGRADVAQQVHARLDDIRDIADRL